jgi:hypothetical protein
MFADFLEFVSLISQALQFADFTRYQHQFGGTPVEKP